MSKHRRVFTRNAVSGNKENMALLSSQIWDTYISASRGNNNISIPNLWHEYRDVTMRTKRDICCDLGIPDDHATGNDSDAEDEEEDRKPDKRISSEWLR